MVFNDEVRREGETTWSGKKACEPVPGPKAALCAGGFSATRTTTWAPAEQKKVYFPHIVTDFDLKSAMRAGLVKSLVLDRRKEIGAPPLEFKAERDGQTTRPQAKTSAMLRAGLMKLRKLETGLCTHRYTPPQDVGGVRGHNGVALVAAFLQEQGLANADEVMTIDSGKKAELGEKTGHRARMPVQRGSPCHATGDRECADAARFDVNNICVIVPLRGSQAQILLEQTIGGVLRLMWRDPEYRPGNAKPRTHQRRPGARQLVGRAFHRGATQHSSRFTMTC